jgi:RNase adaptor protein for sRNA GlmZ degradation
MSLIYIKNTIEILNNILESDTFPLMSGYYTVIKKHDLRSVISLLSDLQTENERLQKMYQEEKAVCHATQLELERMKKIMRKNGIMVIPLKYPGGTARWNIQKPRDQKEK